MARVKNPKCHQSESSYKNGCRCQPCTEAHRLYAREYRRKTRRPDSTWVARKRVDPAEAAAHLRWLQDNGVPLIDIWRACKVDMNTLIAAREGRNKYLFESTANRILAVGTHVVPTYEAVREHVESLLRAGWTQQDIARESGLSDYTIYELHARKRKKVWARTAERVFKLDPTQDPPSR